MHNSFSSLDLRTLVANRYFRNRTNSSAFIVLRTLAKNMGGGMSHRIPKVARECRYQNKNPSPLSSEEGRIFEKLKLLNLHKDDQQSKQNQRFDEYESEDHRREHALRRAGITRDAFHRSCAYFTLAESAAKRCDAHTERCGDGKNPLASAARCLVSRLRKSGGRQ